MKPVLFRASVAWLVSAVVRNLRDFPPEVQGELLSCARLISLEMMKDKEFTKNEVSAGKGN